MGIETTLAIAGAVSALATAGSMTVNYVQSEQQYKQQQAANLATEQSALTARNYQIQQIHARALQERDSASRAIADSRIKAMEDASSAEASAAGHGVQGQTVDALAREYYSKQGRTEEAIQTTANDTIRQLEMEQKGAQASYENRLFSQPVARKPSLLALGLGIGATTANAYTGYMSATRGSSSRGAPQTPQRP